MELTKRAEDIIRILIRFSEDHPVSTNLISEKLGVSTRSIQREMVCVEKWMKEHGYEIQRKRGSGLSIAESEERKKEILQLLDMNPESEQFIFDREKRQRQIRYELLMADEPMKTYFLTDRCDVSEGTLLNDLNQITPWFRKYNLALIRRTGLGIFIQGEELAHRRALTTTIREMIEMNHAFGQHDRKNIHNYCHFIKEWDSSLIEKVNYILSECENHNHMQFSDSGFLSLFIYISLMIHRIQKGNTIYVDSLDQDDLLIQPEYGLAEHLANELHSILDITLSKDEICGIAMQVGSTRVFPTSKRDLTRKRDFDIHQIVISIIREVSNITMIDFALDASLVNDLSIHIQPMIGRLRSNIPIDNPLLENLKTDYPDIYEACTKACTNVIREELGVKEVSPSEIGFITMHFGAAMERKEKNERRIRVVIVCPTGIGSSRLLAADLKLEYPFLDIVGTQSAFDIDKRKLLQDGIDLIISTIKLDTTFRYVQVNTIPTKHDKALINSRIEYLLRQKKKEYAPIIAPTSNINQADVEYISLLGDVIYQILEDIEIDSAPILHNRDELIRYAAVTCAEEPDQADEIYHVLKRRDELDDTYIKPFHAFLLHGRTDLVSKPIFRYVRLEPPFYESGKVILGAIVTLIPDSGELYQVSSVVTSELIGSLLDNNQLLAAMRSGNLGVLRDLVEYELLGFYKRHVAETLGISLDN
ncbi:MAG: transcription antiterminator [Eubacteriales bacterium]|nr:transcription antiterminator [Eubacteriales bacterium]